MLLTDHHQWVGKKPAYIGIKAAIPTGKRNIYHTSWALDRDDVMLPIASPRTIVGMI
jgi:hypothetical protein